MKTIRVKVSTNKVGSMCTRDIHVDDDSTEDEINDIAWETACEMIDYSWGEVTR